MNRRSATPKKSIVRTLGRWGLRLLLVLFALAAIQAAVFYAIANRSFSPGPAELAVLFKGDEVRLALFYQLVEEAKIERIHIPGVSEKTLASWDLKFKASQKIHLQVTPPTDSTFEDALMAAEAIRAHGIRSAVLVTSEYHLPRSWFLLRILTIGRGVAIQPVEVPSRMRLGGFARPAKMIYNEMVKFWGSMTELVYYEITGGLLFEKRQAIVPISILKDMLLFDPS